MPDQELLLRVAAQHHERVTIVMDIRSPEKDQNSNFEVQFRLDVYRFHTNTMLKNSKLNHHKLETLLPGSLFLVGSCPLTFVLSSPCPLFRPLLISFGKGIAKSFQKYKKLIKTKNAMSFFSEVCSFMHSQRE